MLVHFLVATTLLTYTEAVTIHQTLEALVKGLNFMEDRVSEINLDGVFGVRLVAEQLNSLLTFEPAVFRKVRHQLEELKDQARTIADTGMELVLRNGAEYSASVGRLMGRGEKLLWYPSRAIDPEAVVQPLPCGHFASNRTLSKISVFDGKLSNSCMEKILGKKNEKTRLCLMTPKCVELMTAPRQQGYAITHQVLYWELLEMHGCIEDAPENLRVTLCSNVLRDAVMIARANYPRNQRDLFMEQIGLCGIWGFKEFYQREWLNNILKWQQSSGCYDDNKKWHCLGGCLSHETSVALTAIMANLRFQAEEMFEEDERNIFK